MAITQFSRITNRKGLQENLPQLSGAQFGWSLDERRLFIGNGKLVDGAPIIGNTEILTQFSNILEVSTGYTYKGTLAGYEVVTGPGVSTPVVRTLQEKFDDFASVIDFGAVGDGVTDDTIAINRALFELFSRETNTQVRRSLFFPAGTYRVTDIIKVPSFAKLWGEGANSSIIKYFSPDGGTTISSCVLRTADSKQQTGSSIGNFGAVSPSNIEVSSMTIRTTEQHADAIVFVEQATECFFDSVHFVGVGTTADITAADADAAISIRSTAAIISKNITFDKCSTSGTGIGLELPQGARGITFSNGQFDTHYKGVVLSDGGANGSPTGVRLSQNTFDDILAQGIDFGISTTSNISAFNIFYDVGNTFGGTAAFSIIDISNKNNASYGDMFERTDTDNIAFPRVALNETGSIAFDASNKIELGTYVRDVGKVVTLIDATTSAIAVANLSDSTTLNATLNAFNINYTIERGNEIRTGVINVATTSGANTITYNDTFTSNVGTTVTLAVSQATVGSDQVASINYTTTATGTSATLSYSIVRLY
jgi:hypothetical protein